MSLSIESVLIQVRAKLQENGIKLWLSPYYSDGIGPNDSELECLSQNMCQILSIPYDYCLAAINELQTNAIDKLRAREDFGKTGNATLKVRVPNQIGGTKLLTIQTKLNELGDVLHDKVAAELGTSSLRIKLISSGTVVNRMVLLEDQNIQNNQQIMAIVLDTSPTETASENEMYDKLKATKDDAKLLVDKSDAYMDMEDQDGNLIHLPPEEKRALMLALAMHEKGRAKLKREQFSEALILLLEADQEYKTCNSKMLESVDNYALLNLDIVWCYLMLRSVTQLPDAEKRLRICEQNFKRSYGENLDRVLTLKGTAVNEKALIMRLHLLQGVLEFHRNQRNEARRLLNMAEMELCSLKIDDASVNTLIEMGYSSVEARIGLRACSNDINQALSYILDRRERRTKARKTGVAEKITNRLISKTKTDKWVNPRNLHVLNEMGFDKDLCAHALRKSDNDINQALTLLQGNHEALKDELAKDILPDESLCEQMMNMGFDKTIIDMALRTFANNMDAAIEMLLKLQSDGNYAETLQKLTETVMTNVEDFGFSGPSTSTGSDQEKKKIDKAAADEAFERFSEDVENEDDDHLDLPLVQEEKLLIEYKKLF